MIRALALLLAAVPLISAAPLADRLASERQALRQAKVERTAAEQRSRALDAQAGEARGAAERSARELAALRGRVAVTETEIAAAEARLALVRGLQRRRTARLGEQQQPVVQLMAALEARRRRPAVLAVLEPRSLDDLIHTRAVLATVTPAIEARTAALRAELAEARKLSATARASLATLTAARRRLADERVRLAAAERQARQQGLALAGEAMDEGDRALALGERAFDIADRLGDLDAAQTTAARLSPIPPPPMRPGSQSLSTPSAYRLPVAGEVVTGLGEVADTGVTSHGLSFRAAPGAEVRTPRAGRVAFAGPYRSFGPIVILEHGGGWTTLLLGLDAIGVAVGQRVASGAPVARAAGGERPLTVELRRGERVMDPLNQ